MQRLTKKAINKIRGNSKVIGGLVGLFGKHQVSIDRWIESNDIKLTLPAAIEIIKAGTNLTDAEILEDSEPVKSRA